MKQRQVVITGLGIVSPLAADLDAFWNALRSGLGAIPTADNTVASRPVHVFPARFNGDIEDFDLSDAAQKKAVKKALKVMSREIQMALAATCRALNHAQISIGQFPAERIGVSFGSDYIITTADDILDGMRHCLQHNENGSQTNFDFSRWATDGLPKMQPLWQLKYLPNMPGSHIAILNNFHGPSNSITLREASVGACLGESAQIIASGRADAMLVGTTGSRLHPFKFLHAVQQEELSAAACRPFDRERDGTALGEGAGAIVLEEREHAEKRGAAILGEVAAASYRCRCAPKADSGATLCQSIEAVLRDVLRRSGMEPDEIGHINAHGLGARQADAIEAQAIRNIFGKRERPIPLTALKGFFGNLGAGGGTVEFIAGVLALRHQTLFPALGFSVPDPECGVVPVKIGETVPAGDSFLKLAFNRQGHACAVIVRSA